MDKKEFSSIANLMSSLLGGDFEKMLKEIKEELEKEDKKNNSEEAYGFSKTNKMIPVWVAPTQEVVYTMEDIEKKLGLEPGSLKIK